MYQVVAPFAVTIPVASGDDYGEVVVCELGAGSNGQGAPVKAVEHVALEIMGKLGRLSDARY